MKSLQKGISDMAKEKNLNVKLGKNEKGLERKYEV